MKKFEHPYRTADGEERAYIDLERLEMIWFNTGTLCNIECKNCYIESSPLNDRLVYLSLDDVVGYLDEVEREGYPVRQLGFTGGEPFMNPEMNVILDESLRRGFEVLVLTNAMIPMMRRKVREGLLGLLERYGTERIIMRVSLDHYSRGVHDEERGRGSWEKALAGLKWLSGSGFRVHIAGRQLTEESLDELYRSYHALLDRHRIKLDVLDKNPLVIFPEMDERADVPEITTKCWNILGVDPGEIMCATSRMVVRRKGRDRASVVACTLLPYDEEFEVGDSLKESRGRVHLNHPHCARFCVLGGGSCSG